MSRLEELRVLLAERPDEVAERWLEEHLLAAPLASDDAPIRAAHRLATPTLGALTRALSGADPDDWGSFVHREAVQLVALMARSLADSEATAASVGALVPSLGLAFERLGASAVSGLLIPLTSVACESLTAARLSAQERRHLESLARTTPVVVVRQGVVLVAACGAPDQDVALTVVDRALSAVLELESDAPVVVLDLTHLQGATDEAVAVLLSLPSEIRGLGGTPVLVGLTEAYLEATELSLDGVARWSTVSNALEAVGPFGLLRRLGRAFKR